jgi:hypothetical protein
MKRMAIPLVGLTASLLLAASASAALRAPQVPVLGGTLQGYLNSVGEAINVNTDQDATQTWSTTVSGNSTFSLMIELTGNAATNTLGIYNGPDAVPPLYLVFPGAATTGWFATAAFRSAPDRVVISLFDQNSAFQGSTTYLAGPPNRNNFGYYLQRAGGPTFYTQDARNPGGAAQALAYKGTGINFGQWWLCFEDSQRGAGGSSDSDFDDAVLFLESITPTPVHGTTWGTLKSRFR